MGRSVTGPGAAASTSLKDQLIGWGRSAFPAIVSGIGFVGFVSLLGAAVVWMRYSTAGLPADQAVHDLPLSEWVATGAVTLVLYLLLGLAAALVVYLLQEAVIASMLNPGDAGKEGQQLQLALVRNRVKQLGDELSSLAPEGKFPDPTSPAGERYVVVKNEQTVLSGQADDLAHHLFSTEQKDAESSCRGSRWGLLVLVGAELIVVLLRTDLSTEWKLLLSILTGLMAAAAIAVGAFKPGDSKGLAGAMSAILGFFVIVLVWKRGWTFAPVLAVVLLALASLAIARLHPRSFFWTGIAIFASVAVFGAVLTYSRDANAPSAQGAAVLLKNGCAVRGLWIGESSSRVFLARLAPPSGEAETNGPFSPATTYQSGRVFWVNRSQVASEWVGKLERVPLAEEESGQMRGEVLALDKGTTLTEKQCGETAATSKLKAAHP
jgi:hypothetical protein